MEVHIENDDIKFLCCEIFRKLPSPEMNDTNVYFNNVTVGNKHTCKISTNCHY